MVDDAALDDRVFRDVVGDQGVDEADAPRFRARRQRSGRWKHVAERWVPEPLRESRVDPGRHGALVIGVVAALAAVIAAVGVWRGRPDSQPVAAVSLAASASDVSGMSGMSGAGFSTAFSTRPSRTGSASANSDGAAPSRVLVSVTGKVAHPGVVSLPAGSRVADAIRAAGGATKAADITGLNLAAKVNDGDSVVIPGPGETGSPVGPASATGSGRGTAPTSSPAAPVDLNTADAATLDALPGVGPVTAGDIVTWRQQHGRFSSVDQLQEIPGIGPAKFAHLAPLVTVG